MVWDRDNLNGRLVVRDIVPSVREAVREAREAGAAVVIAVVHSGLDEPSSYDTVSTGVPSENVAARLAREVPDIDLLVYGHSHKEMADTVIGKTLLMQPKNWATSVAIAHLTMQRQNGRWRVTAKRSQIVAAVNHDGDSDSTGAITGNIVGTPAFGRITNTRFSTGESGSSRQIQFALKLMF